MKQYDLFGAKGDDEENKYTVKIKAPIYEPKNKKPHILELYDKTKTLRLIQEIDRSSLTYEEKFFFSRRCKTS